MFYKTENGNFTGFYEDKDKDKTGDYTEITIEDWQGVLDKQSQGEIIFYNAKSKKIDSIKLNQYETFDGTTLSTDIVAIKKSILDVLSKLKIEYAQKEFLFQEKYWQKNRDVDKANLTSIVVMLTATKQTTFPNWKFKDLDGVDVYVHLTTSDMMSLANIMQTQTTKALITESTLIKKIEALSVEELKKFDSIAEFKALIEV